MVQELWKSICNFYHKVDTVQVHKYSDVIYLFQTNSV